MVYSAAPADWAMCYDNIQKLDDYYIDAFFLLSGTLVQGLKLSMSMTVLLFYNKCVFTQTLCLDLVWFGFMVYQPL